MLLCGSSILYALHQKCYLNCFWVWLNTHIKFIHCQTCFNKNVLWSCWDIISWFIDVNYHFPGWPLWLIPCSFHFNNENYCGPEKVLARFNKSCPDFKLLCNTLQSLCYKDKHVKVYVWKKMHSFFFLLLSLYEKVFLASYGMSCGSCWHTEVPLNIRQSQTRRGCTLSPLSVKQSTNWV